MFQTLLIYETDDETRRLDSRFLLFVFVCQFIKRASLAGGVLGMIMYIWGKEGAYFRDAVGHARRRNKTTTDSDVRQGSTERLACNVGCCAGQTFPTSCEKSYFPIIYPLIGLSSLFEQFYDIHPMMIQPRLAA